MSILRLIPNPAARLIPNPAAGPSRLLLRPMSTSIVRPMAKKTPSFSRPSPPKLSAEDQAEFESLVKANNSAVGATPRMPGSQKPEPEQHPDLRKGPKKQFEGDTNPSTGEVGGPKTDPFIAGQEDWQYGGRVTVDED